jgi:hypothetical protein
MNRQYTYSRNWKRIAGAAIAGFALTALFYELDSQAAQGCPLLRGAGWVVLEILQPVIVVGWQSVQAYLSENPRFWQHLPQVVVAVWPLA